MIAIFRLRKKQPEWERRIVEAFDAVKHLPFARRGKAVEAMMNYLAHAHAEQARSEPFPCPPELPG